MLFSPAGFERRNITLYTLYVAASGAPDVQSPTQTLISPKVFLSKLCKLVFSKSRHNGAFSIASALSLRRNVYASPPYSQSHRPDAAAGPANPFSKALLFACLRLTYCKRSCRQRPLFAATCIIGPTLNRTLLDLLSIDLLYLIFALSFNFPICAHVMHHPP